MLSVNDFNIPGLSIDLVKQNSRNIYYMFKLRVVHKDTKIALPTTVNPEHNDVTYSIPVRVTNRGDIFVGPCNSVFSNTPLLYVACGKNSPFFIFRSFIETDLFKMIMSDIENFKLKFKLLLNALVNDKVFEMESAINSMHVNYVINSL